MEHECPQVVAQGGHHLGLRQTTPVDHVKAFPLHRPMACRAQEGEPVDGAAMGAQVPGDQSSEGEPGQVDGGVGAEQSCQAVFECLYPRVAVVAGEAVGVAVARHVGRPDGSSRVGQRWDVAYPVPPGSVAAMQQDDGRALASVAPTDIDAIAGDDFADGGFVQSVDELHVATTKVARGGRRPWYNMVSRSRRVAPFFTFARIVVHAESPAH